MKQLSRIVRSVKAFSQEMSRQRDSAEAHTRLLPRPKLGLAFGGGFARGLAHIGILKVLEEEKIPVDFIGGTSVGAVIGAAYASGVGPKEMEEIAQLVRFKDFARWTISRFGMCSNDRMSGFLDRLVRVKKFEELRIPLVVAATDFATGEGVLFNSGCLIDAVRASCAYPGMFLPVSIDGRLLVDGLLGYPVPTKPLKEMGADRVIAVHLSAHWVKSRGPRHVFEVIGQCFSIAQDKMRAGWEAHSDVVLEPAVGDFGYDSFTRASDLIRIGAESIREVIPTIRSWYAGTELDIAPALPAPVAEPIIAPAEAPLAVPSTTLPEAAA